MPPSTKSLFWQEGAIEMIHRFSLVGFSALLVVSALPLPASAQSVRQAFEICRRSKDPAEKVRYCTVVIQNASDRQDLERLYLRRGNSFMELGRFEEAVSDFSNLIRINPRIAGYYDNRQSALNSLGLTTQALADANTAISLAPTQGFVYRSRGFVLESMQRYNAAINDFDRAISIDPANNGLVIDRARIMAKAGLVRQAIGELSRVISIEPSNMSAYKERGIAYLAYGNTAAAESDLLFFARANPEDQQVSRALDEINGRKSASLMPEPARAPSPAANNPPVNSPKAADSNEEKGGMGTGFFISSEGHIVTNAHVVAGCSILQARAGIGLQIDARVLAKDTANDLALLKVEAKPAAYGLLRTGVRTGENVAAFGYPLYGLLATTGNFTVGNVSAVAGIGDDTRYLQISAPVQPGNSGGPVLDQSGNVVGVVVAKLNVLKVASAIDDVPQNVNFAIKASVLTNFLESTGVAIQSGNASNAVSSADLAEKAKSISVFLKCAP
jgi:S1-C subfamily serine protease